ncbi:DNA polymerase III subunit epsilon [Aquibium carbonis]|uniref:DNA polymerase III subunit epsilon n=1 Tax=Aquibium carbonis TaxID=2495581 RepID=A0A3R9YAV5_9HYPH|nr:DNA polymerase III subunit epsilon [Aquibium carbonis]RST88133.1 DNA polymerase III subunit epsilon [Aquibium carbonis]
MREIIFDTETTGLDSREDRIIEIGGVELVNRFPSGRFIHFYIHPGDRQIHPEAQAVHGISLADLQGKPRFAEIAEEFLAFTEGAKLIAHNAGFDMGFVNQELARIGMDPIPQDRVIDTLAIAKRKHPMGPNSLDALCRRYGVDNSRRTKHGALLDSELLAEVYIELVGGKQAALGLEIVETVVETSTDLVVTVILSQRPRPLAPRLAEAERAAHAAMIERIGDGAIWKKLLPAQAVDSGGEKAAS